MQQWRRVAGKWVLRAVLAFFVLAALYVTILAYPRPLFPHQESFRGFSVYANHPIPEGFGGIIAETRYRINAMEHRQSGAEYRIYMCGNEKLYSLFAGLTRRSANSLAIGLSVFGTIYMNEAKIRRFADNERGIIRHSRFEGNFAEVIAHEVAHFNVVDAIGYRKAVSMPVWKSEGNAEYQANLAATRADSSYRLTDRIRLLLDDQFWGYENSLARSLFEWRLVVEYLYEIEGYRLGDLLDDHVTEASARSEMLAWYSARISPYE